MFPQLSKKKFSIKYKSYLLRRSVDYIAILIQQYYNTVADIIQLHLSSFKSLPEPHFEKKSVLHFQFLDNIIHNFLLDLISSQT